MSRRGRSPKIVMPGERSRRMKGRAVLPKADAVLVRAIETPRRGVLLKLPLQEGGSVSVLFPADQARALAIQIFKCYLAVSGEKLDVGSILKGP